MHHLEFANHKILEAARAAFAWEIGCIYQVILSACLKVKMNAHTSAQNQRMFLMRETRCPALRVFKVT